MRPEWPELSDLILDTDPDTLERRPVSRAAVRMVLDGHGMRSARRILDRIGGGDTLDTTEVDGILVRSHAELQRLAFEFRNGERLVMLLRPLVDVLRGGDRRIRIVDIGCGMGFLLRWLAAHGRLGAEVELVGCDFNPTLISTARALADEERLDVEFRVANAFTLERPADVYISSGVLHHFRGDDLGRFFAMQAQTGARAMLHLDIKHSWAAPLGAWIFHRARMREPLARHDGVLSAIRAHPREALVSASTGSGRPLLYALFDGRPSPLPILRTLNVVVGIEAARADAYVAALGDLAPRLEAFA